MPQSLHSLLMAKRSAESSPINYVRQIPGPTSPSHESDKDQKQERFFPTQGIEEKELNGTSEMVYDDSLRSPDSTISSNTTPLAENCGLSEAFLQGADQPVLRLKAAEVIVSNHQETDRLGSENEILKLQSQMYLQKISLLENSLIDFAALREELNLRNSEVYEIKSHFRRTKQEDDDTLQQLSAENAFLRSAQIDTEISVNNAQKKYSALDGVKAELLEQIKGLELRVSEATVSGRKSAEYLAKAERQISQLDSDNASLRKLRIDLDAASRDNAQQSRLVLSLESQIAILKAENTQLRRANAGTNGGKVNTTSGSGGDYFGYIDQQLPPPSVNRISPVSAAIRPPQYRDLELHSVSDLDQYPQHIHPHRIHDGEFSNHQHDSMNAATSFSKSPQSLSAFASSSSSSYKNRDLKGNFVGNDHENENNYRNKSEGINSPRDLIPSTRDQRNPAVSTSSSVRTLADLVGDRRNASGFTDASSRDSDSNDEKSRRNEGAVRLSTNLDGNRNWSMSGGNAAPGVSSVNVSPTSVTISSDKKQHSEVKSYRGSSSGGGMSSFHDDSSESASRAPFGTDQSAVVNMVSFEDTDRKLTALMTEKSVLYEESARLQQKGGKVLKDRARLQYIDARLVEVGREIASERKKLSGKPG